MTQLHCVITSPEGLIFAGNARSVVVPAVDGELGILPRHAPLIGALGRGIVRIQEADASTNSRFFVSGGFLQILKNEVTILATEAEPRESFVRTAAEEKVKAQGVKLAK